MTPEDLGLADDLAVKLQALAAGMAQPPSAPGPPQGGRSRGRSAPGGGRNHKARRSKGGRGGERPGAASPAAQAAPPQAGPGSSAGTLAPADGRVPGGAPAAGLLPAIRSAAGGGRASGSGSAGAPAPLPAGGTAAVPATSPSGEQLMWGCCCIPLYHFEDLSSGSRQQAGRYTWLAGSRAADMAGQKRLSAGTEFKARGVKISTVRRILGPSRQVVRAKEAARSAVGTRARARARQGPQHLSGPARRRWRRLAREFAWRQREAAARWRRRRRRKPCRRRQRQRQ